MWYMYFLKECMERLRLPMSALATETRKTTNLLQKLIFWSEILCYPSCCWHRKSPVSPCIIWYAFEGVLHLLPKIGMFCALSQNNQQLFEQGGLEPRVSPTFAITYFCNHCNIKLKQRSLTPWCVDMVEVCTEEQIKTS